MSILERSGTQQSLEMMLESVDFPLFFIVFHASQWMESRKCLWTWVSGSSGTSAEPTRRMTCHSTYYKKHYKRLRAEDAPRNPWDHEPDFSMSCRFECFTSQHAARSGAYTDLAAFHVHRPLELSKIALWAVEF